MDYNAAGFDCVTYPEKKSFRSWKEGADLKCTSPEEFEEALKSCHNHQILEVTICVLNLEGMYFECEDPLGKQYRLALPASDNYFCVNEADRKRLLERCH